MLAKCGKIRNQHIGGFLRMRTNWLLFYRNCFENFGLFANLIMMFHNIQIESNDWIITKIIAHFVNKSFTGTRVFLNNPDLGVPPRKSHFTFVILKHLIFTFNFIAHYCQKVCSCQSSLLHLNPTLLDVPLFIHVLNNVLLSWFSVLT